MLIREYIEARSNIEVLIRERGKLVGRRESHNIFPTCGTTWLAQLVCGDVSNVIKYMGAGIGGSKQNNPLVDLAPLNAYPTVGAHSQTDTDMSVTAIERPVAISSTAVPIVQGSATWLKQIALPTHPTANSTRFVCVFTESDFNFGTFGIVPLSELALFTSEKNVLVGSNQFCAYDTLAPIPKTSALELEMRWVVSF